MATKYRVAVIGRTDRGNYGHDLDTVWLDLEEAEVVAVADEDEQGRAEAAQRLGAPKTYADYREMLEEERPDFVSVAPRWLDCHRDMVIACAEHGCHVFLEKPMCRTLAEADEITAACERANVKLALAHQTRYSPRLQRVQEMISEGMLGEILELRGRGKEDGRGGGEDLIVLGTHVMDLIRLLAGDPKWCFARVLEGDVRVTRKRVLDGPEGIGPLAGDRIDAMYGFDTPTIAYFSTQRNGGAEGQRFGLRVHGSKGMLDMTTGSLPRVLFLDDPLWGVKNQEWIPVTSSGLGEPERLEDGGLHQGNVWIAQDLIHAVEHDTQPRGSMYDGRAALEMILAVYESHRLNAPVALPLQNREHPLSLL